MPGAKGEKGMASIPEEMWKGKAKGNTRHPAHAGGTETTRRLRERHKESGTGGYDSMQEKEAALRFGLQMTTITRTGASEVEGEVGEWVVERLRGIAATAGIYFLKKRAISEGC